MFKRLRGFFPILLFTFLPTIAIWAPFLFRLDSIWGIKLPTNGMATVVANYDGPLFLVVAKTLYNVEQIKSSFSFPLSAQYYAAHFPLFPLLIRLFAMVVGFPYGLLIATLVSSLLATYFFHKFISQYFENSDDAYWVTLMFSIFPARWLIVRSVGSSEPLFIAAIIASVYYFKNKRYLLAGLWGAVAQLTKSPAILLFVAYTASIAASQFHSFATKDLVKLVEKVHFSRLFYICLIPLSLVGLFFFYHLQFGDFLAYFHSGDNIHLFFPPFQIFNYTQPWVGTFWLEEVIFVYLFGLVGLMKLIRMKEETLAWFVGVFFVSIMFVSHRDIIRYALPIVPFLFVAFKDAISKPEFKVVVLVLGIPIYLFSLAYISGNVMPISDWAPFL